MSRVLHPAGWKPTCWTVFLASVSVLTLVTMYYTVGAP